ncbi:MAG: DUF86 domain-containing protein [Clostridiales bacterium]|jgi:uncharacterized protein with HEPN domain|nr:DUF86 domain-containing protein [Clostridiales bacterium]
MADENLRIIRRMLQESAYILQFVDGLTPDLFAKDEKSKRAVTQTLANIGELENSLSAEFKKKYAKVPWAAIRRTRNVIAHEYLSVNFQTIWQTANESIPELIVLLDQIEKSETGTPQGGETAD